MPTDFDLESNPKRLHDKYIVERDKRLRPEGNAQYVPVDDEFAGFGDDPHDRPGFSREPISEDVEVALIGGGHAGLLASHALREAGIDDFRIIEKAGDFGGTWYWNRYPNCRCDVESYIYLPLVEQFGEMPTEKYVRSSEILAHAQRVARQLDLYPHTIFQTAVSEMVWDEKTERWMISTDRGDTIRAKFVTLGSGPLNRPKLPGIPGIKTFKGKSFHTSRWDYGYTLGDETGGLSGLKDKRVAIIGTGATAVQAITALGESCGHLYVVQRTPAAVEARNNRPTDPAWWKSWRHPGWWEKRARNFDAFSAGEVQEEDLVADGWTTSWAKFSEASRQTAAETEAAPVSIEQLVDYEKMGAIRASIDQKVHNPDTADALKPYYNWFCKRPLFHDGYYETFNRPNVTLIDTQGKGVDLVTENAIIYDGKTYEIDCIIYASGFEAAAPSNRSGGFSLVGKGGMTIEKHWANGMRTLHGMFVHGFPNLGIIHGIKQAATTWNGTYILAKHTQHFVDVVRRCREQNVSSFEATTKAEEAWLSELSGKATADLEFLAECTPGYINNEGQNLTEAIYSSTYGSGVFEYLKVLEHWRETDLQSDLELTEKKESGSQ